VGGFAAPAAMPGTTPPAGGTPPKRERVPAPKGTAGVMIPAPATIVVSLPADAKLSVDGHATTSTDEMRTFVSPALEPGRDFVYDLKGEVVRQGKTVIARREVTVHAGEETRVSLDFGTTRLVQK